MNSKDEVFAFTRNADNPIVVFDREGNILRTFGQGIFGKRTHGILIGPDDSVWCVDDGIHTLTNSLLRASY